jgi:Xaa-Pro aminopeptidase
MDGEDADLADFSHLQKGSQNHEGCEKGSLTMSTPNDRIPRAELDRRLVALQRCLQANRLDGALILQKADLLYFAGTIQQAQLYVPAEGPPLLMVRKSVARARAECPLERVVSLQRAEEVVANWRRYGYPLPRRLGLEFDVLPVQLFLKYRQLFDQTELRDVSGPIRRLRAVKSVFEISMIREAARLADEVTAGVPELLEEGISEVAFAGRVEARARALGHPGIVRMRLWGSELFYGHILSGSNAAEPSYLSSPTGGKGVTPAVAQGAGFKRIRRHEPVLVDYVFVYNGYLADQTRIFSLGELGDDLVRGHRAMLAVQARLKQSARPGVAAGELYRQARELAAASGYEAAFMGADQERVRFVGHGVGLELDEFPFLAQGQRLPLEAGMVIALEPKLIFPGKGAVGIENTHVITAGGLEQLTRHPEEIVVL